MSNLTYFENTYKFEDIATIESFQSDDKGFFLTLDHTIFYPQGGGQPSDQGQLKYNDISIPILSVKMVKDEIRHYTDQHYGHLIGQKVICLLDKERRLLHAKLHTAGHLLSHIVESLYPCFRATKGHHFPGECYVEFMSGTDDIKEIDLVLLNQNIEKLIAENLPIKSISVDKQKISEICPEVPNHLHAVETVRMVSIGNFKYQPCGGTHVRTTLDLQGFEVTKFKINKNLLKISYSLRNHNNEAV